MSGLSVGSAYRPGMTYWGHQHGHTVQKRVVGPVFSGHGDRSSDPATPEKPKLGLFRTTKRRIARIALGTLLGAATFVGGGRIITPFELTPPAAASQEIGWQENVKVLASNGQDQLGYFDMLFNHWYTNGLLDVLEKDRVNTLAEAHEILMERGYKAFPYFRKFPTETARDVAGWDKREDKPRYMILWRQLEESEGNKGGWQDRVRLQDLNRMKRVFQEQYNIPEENILVIEEMNTDGRDDVRRSFDWLKERLAENPGAEVALYYVGHGGASGTEGARLEGEAHGFFNGTNETRLKRHVNSLTDFSSFYIILDTCHSGAWVSL